MAVAAAGVSEVGEHLQGGCYLSVESLVERSPGGG
jgi:hypothetical protein